MSSSRRDRLHIYADILGGAFEPERPTRIMSRANISYAPFRRELKRLLRAGLIEHIKGTRLLRTTTKGFKYLQALKALYRMLEADSDSQSTNINPESE